MRVLVSASQKIPLSVLARNAHKGLAREISRETEGGREKECPRAEEKESVNRSGQKIPVT